MSLLATDYAAKEARQENRHQMRAVRVLVSAYHHAKGLDELLSVLDDPLYSFSEEERAQIAVAHKAANLVYDSLNKIVIDKGQAS